MRASSMGIYGDSFACCHEESKHFAWYNLLAEKLNTTVLSSNQALILMVTLLHLHFFLIKNL